jgi:hypothetical protein
VALHWIKRDDRKKQSSTKQSRMRESADFRKEEKERKRKTVKE